MGQILPLILAQDVELVGEWQIDYTTSKVRGNGQFGPFFGISIQHMAKSVPLSFLDRAYLPADLEVIEKNRKSNNAVSGVRSMHLKLRSFETGELQDAYCFKNVIRDRFGLIKEARGVLFATPTVATAFDGQRTDRRHEEALRHLVAATNAVGQLGYEHLRPMLQVIFKEVAQDAIRSIDTAFNPHTKSEVWRPTRAKVQSGRSRISRVIDRRRMDVNPRGTPMSYTFDERDRRRREEMVEVCRLSMATAKTYPEYSEKDLKTIRDVASRTLKTFRMLGDQLPKDEPYCIDGQFFNAEMNQEG